MACFESIRLEMIHHADMAMAFSFIQKAKTHIPEKLSARE